MYLKFFENKKNCKRKKHHHHRKERNLCSEKKKSYQGNLEQTKIINDFKLSIHFKKMKKLIF